MSSTITLKVSGLHLEPNQLDVPPGSLIQANNCVVRRDGVIEPRRGFHTYGTSFNSIADRAKQLFTYKTRILRHVFDNNSVSNKLQFDSDGNGTFLPFAGAYNEAKSGLRIKSIEANGNFYFTTDEGIKKISVLDASGFSTASGFITNAGGIKATDVSARIKLTQGNISGFLPQDSTVAYRIVWGSNDANGNLILGAPSQRAVIYNPLINMLLLDYSTLIHALDGIASASLINNGNYVNTFKLPSSASASDLYSSLQNLTTAIDNNILYADTISAPLIISSFTANGTVTTVNFSSGNPQNYFSIGSRIRLANFTTVSGNSNGAQQVTFLTPTSLQFNATGNTFSSLTGATINSYEYEARAPSATAIPLQVGSPYPLPATPPTDDDLVNLQGTVQSIMVRLQSEPNATINSSVATIYIAPLSITTTASVLVTFSVPQDVTLNNFYQVYRSHILQATGSTVLTNLTPDDEMRLVFEAFVTPADLSARTVTIEDITPDSFAGANLYSNQISGEGSLQTNDIPPFALDINKFKNTTFYANTKTRQRKQFSLLGVVNMVDSYNPSNKPTITITNGITTNTYTFVIGVDQVTQVTTTSGATLAASGPGSYFTINSANDVTKYYVWYKIGTSVDPAIANRVGIQVNALVGDNSTQIAQKTRDAIAAEIFDFNTSSSTNVITITNINQGYTSNPTVGTSGFTIVVTVSGSGERASTNEVLLSTNISPSIAVDETARSLIRVVNQNVTDGTYLYYLSSTSGVPGQFFAEARNINNPVFYIMANNTTTGQSFSPDLSPDLTITSITAATQAVVTTSTPHLLLNGSQIVISDSNSTPTIDGLRIITYISPTSFSVPVTTTVLGTSGAIRVATDAVFSSNGALPNRIYYSKLNQPEAVPIVNTLDIGAKDKAILRIFPLRDSLFVFKEDGLYRISGEIAPFTVSLFDGSTILLSSDSLGLANNLIYGWTTQGVSATSESGVSTVSRPIDIDILKLASNNYPNFPTVTWGIGYESDNSYTVYTNQNITDTVATIGYRYSNLTNTWTTIGKSNTCGIINPVDDRMYTGAGDISFIEQERKTFTRLDYSDRELTETLATGSYFGATISFSNITGISVGDAVVQNQLLTVYTFNSLLQKLDLDSDIAKVSVSSITTGLTPIITTTVAHNLLVNDFVTLLNTNSTPIIDGVYKVLSVPTTTTFSVLLVSAVTIAGTTGVARLNYTQSLSAKGGDDLSVDLIKLASRLDGDPNTVNKNYSSLVASRSGSITANTIANPTVLTSTAHGLVNGRIVTINGSNSSPSIDGNYAVTVVDVNRFSIPVNVNLTSGTSGSFITQDTTFADIVARYNAVILNLNSDAGVSFKNYLTSTLTTTYEALVIGVNQQTKTLTLDTTLDFIAGQMIIFKAIDCEFTYSPNTMGDPLSLKHFRESTVMFENKAFSSCTFSFASDLNPAFSPIAFVGDGNGIFGTPKFGTNYFGGNSNGAPFRTIVPRSCQRGRYLLLKFNHTVAREKISIYGVTLTGEVTSIRAYR